MGLADGTLSVAPAKAGAHNHRASFCEDQRPQKSTDRFRGMGPGFRRDDRGELHHRHAGICSAGDRVSAGERAISAFSDANAGCRFRPPKPATRRPLRRPPPRYVTPKAGVEPAFPWCEVSDIFTTSASLEPHQRAANMNSAAALIDAPPVANSEEFALPSVSGSSPRSLRQAPRAWARALSRGPRDPGLPFRLEPGNSKVCSGQEKTLRSDWLGRVRVERTVRSRLGKIAPKSRACVIDRHHAAQQAC